jgi:hypothetical protein
MKTAISTLVKVTSIKSLKALPANRAGEKAIVKRDNYSLYSTIEAFLGLDKEVKDSIESFEDFYMGLNKDLFLNGKFRLGTSGRVSNQNLNNILNINLNELNKLGVLVY